MAVTLLGKWMDTRHVVQSMLLVLVRLSSPLKPPSQRLVALSTTCAAVAAPLGVRLPERAVLLSGFGVTGGKAVFLFLGSSEKPAGNELGSIIASEARKWVHERVCNALSRASTGKVPSLMITLSFTTRGKTELT